MPHKQNPVKGPEGVVAPCPLQRHAALWQCIRVGHEQEDRARPGRSKWLLMPQMVVCDGRLLEARQTERPEQIVRKPGEAMMRT